MTNLFSFKKNRYLNHVRLRARNIAPGLVDWPTQFTHFSETRGDADSCIVSNGISRSGTYLLSSLVDNLGHWQNIGLFINGDRSDFESVEQGSNRYLLPQYSVKKLQNGQCVAGHLSWSPAIEKSLSQTTRLRRFKHLLMVRDPRDVFVSQWRSAFHPEVFSVPVESGSFAERVRRRGTFGGDDERLSYILTDPDYWDWSFPVFEAWLNNPDCYVIKFEDLYTETLALREDGLGNVLLKLCEHLEIDSSVIDPVELYDKVYLKSRTATTEPHKIGQYKKVFKDQHYALINNTKFRKVLNAFGYEW